jgi:hypothetical protein
MKFSYLEGVERAEANGSIVYGTCDEEDSHTVLPPEGSIDHFNTRPLHEAAKMVVPFLNQQPSKALVLGGGTGGACLDIKTIAPACSVHSVSLTPFNPYVRITLTSEEIYKQTLQLVGPDVLQERRMQTTYGRHHERIKSDADAMTADHCASVTRMMGCDPRNDPGTHVPTSLVEELQSQGKLAAFASMEIPFCDMQHVTYFPDEFSVPDTFDFIYDDRGPLYYVTRQKCGTVDDATIDAIRFLSPRGMLFAVHYQPLMSRAPAVRAAMEEAKKTDALFIQAEGELLVVQPEHPLFVGLQTYLSQKTEMEQGVFLLHHQGAQSLLLDVISK